MLRLEQLPAFEGLVKFVDSYDVSLLLLIMSELMLGLYISPLLTSLLLSPSFSFLFPSTPLSTYVCYILFQSQSFSHYLIHFILYLNTSLNLLPLFI